MSECVSSAFSVAIDEVLIQLTAFEIKRSIKLIDFAGLACTEMNSLVHKK